MAGGRANALHLSMRAPDGPAKHSNMRFFNRLTAILATAMLVAPTVPLEARTRKGDKYLAEGRSHESKREWDEALSAYEKALSEDPSEIVYQMAAEKTRFQAAQNHVNEGLKIRAK